MAYNKANREYEIINKRIDIDSKEDEGKVHFIRYFYNFLKSKEYSMKSFVLSSLQF